MDPYTEISKVTYKQLGQAALVGTAVGGGAGALSSGTAHRYTRAKTRKGREHQAMKAGVGVGGVTGLIAGGPLGAAGGASVGALTGKYGGYKVKNKRLVSTNRRVKKSAFGIEHGGSDA